MMKISLAVAKQPHVTYISKIAFIKFRLHFTFFLLTYSRMLFPKLKFLFDSKLKVLKS